VWSRTSWTDTEQQTNSECSQFTEKWVSRQHYYMLLAAWLSSCITKLITSYTYMFSYYSYFSHKLSHLWQKHFIHSVAVVIVLNLLFYIRLRRRPCNDSVDIFWRPIKLLFLLCAFCIIWFSLEVCTIVGFLSLWVHDNQLSRLTILSQVCYLSELCYLNVGWQYLSL